MLFLVDLAGLDAGEDDAVAVDGKADFEEHVGSLELDDLGPDDRGVAAVRLLDEDPHRARLEHDVVPADEEECGTFDAGEGDVARLGERPRPSSRRTKAWG